MKNQAYREGKVWLGKGSYDGYVYGLGRVFVYGKTVENVFFAGIKPVER